MVTERMTKRPTIILQPTKEGHNGAVRETTIEATNYCSKSIQMRSTEEEVQLVGLAGGTRRTSQNPQLQFTGFGTKQTQRQGWSFQHLRQAHTGMLVWCDFVNWDTGRARTDAMGLRFRAEIEKRWRSWRPLTRRLFRRPHQSKFRDTYTLIHASINSYNKSK